MSLRNYSTRWRCHPMLFPLPKSTHAAAYAAFHGQLFVPVPRTMPPRLPPPNLAHHLMAVTALLGLDDAHRLVGDSCMAQMLGCR
jgi:hypothetical protein